MRVRVFLALALPAAVAAWAEASVPGTPVTHAAGLVSAARLEAGSVAEFAWSASGSAPFDEMELVLSLDGGRTFPLRVTGALAPGTERVTWRVPALSTDHARLALRAGVGEESDAEEILSVSDEFSIAATSRHPLEELFRVRGEWRTREALAASPGPPLETSLGGSPEGEMRSATEPEPAAAPPRFPAGPAATETSTVRRAASASVLPTASRADALRPLVVPLRQ